VKHVFPVIKVDFLDLSLHQINCDNRGLRILWREVLKTAGLNVEDEISPANQKRRKPSSE